MSSEITDAVQVIHILFEGTDLFLRVAGVGIKPLKQLAKLIMGILAREKMEGKTTMKNLLKRGGDMHVFKFPQEQFKKVEAMAKKYGILFSRLPDFNKDGMREIAFHAESLPRMNALIEKLKEGQVMGLGEYLQETSDRDIDKFYEETRQGRTEEKEMAGKDRAGQQKNTGDKAQSINGMGTGKKPEWMDTGYLKMKDIEALPLDQRLDVLNHYQSGEHDPITITGKLITKETEDYVVVRLPRQTGKFIHIPKEDFFFPDGSRTALAFLKKKEEMKIYTEHGEEMMQVTGNEIYHGYFDQVNANIRTAMEHKSEERGMEQGRMERIATPEAGEQSTQEYSSTERSGQPEIQRTVENGRDERNIHTETGRTSEKKQNREEKASPSKPERPTEKVRSVKEIRQPVKGR
ncbi:MAG: PcfB family protein [Lachnospiraceae bacterium]|nr:PcfB family protein [Lachnospiraceae bacterium]